MKDKNIKYVQSIIKHIIYFIINHMQVKSNVQTFSIQIDDGILIINDTIVPYSEQIMRTKDVLFVTDLGIEVPIDAQLRAYDEDQFHFLLKQQLIYELEANHVSIGLQILQQLPQLQPEHYEQIFLTLTTNKIQKILINDNFMLFLCKTLSKFAKREPLYDAEQIKQTILINFPDPYQRILYLLGTLEEYYGKLKDALEITASDIINQVVDKPNFMQSLAYPTGFKEQRSQQQQKDEEISCHFLSKIYYFTIAFQYLSKIPSDVVHEYNFSFNKMLKEHLFNKNFLNLIGKHFQHLYLYDRKKMLVILTLIATYNKKQFWGEVINYSNHDQSNNSSLKLHQEIERQPTSNANSFREFMLNSYFSNDRCSWDQSLYILEALSENENSSDEILIDLFQDLLKFPIKTEIIDLIISFIRKIFRDKKEREPRFKRFLTGFMQSINDKIDDSYAKYQAKSKKVKWVIMRLTRLNLLKLNSLAFCAYFRVYSMVVELNIFNCLSDMDIERRIQALLLITSNQYGLMDGAKNSLTKKLKVKLVSEKLLAGKSENQTCLSFARLRKLFGQALDPE